TPVAVEARHGAPAGHRPRPHRSGRPHRRRIEPHPRHSLRHPEGRLMIRHRPSGSGHPYSVDTEQRWPVVPEAGASATLGVRADASISAVSAELTFVPDDGDDSERTTLQLGRVASTSRGRITDGGHLASAASRLARSAGGWQVSTPALRSGGTYRYRFTGTRADGTTERTREFEFRAAVWDDAPGAVVETGGARVIAGSVR